METLLITGEAPGLVVNGEDSRSEPWRMWVRIPASPNKKLDGKR